ncbi:PrsW family intramembrane metalloprotease [Oscillatoria sp. FACHB-1407]|uniref:PrsW family glutamic-type intramembrane protease n=1 Tax=Oscillatoria sp. FACHB-1407 TaxID=2692847 RepID=UPI00168390DA|nr:PrsW family glutamic-type intramembrane protease [Oscillatoria sp. FACHB-1407]MBD2462996.1 PrsW family intramembrane metalloprotease [Oscillatoria sp. FACHB-1407]
MTGPAAATPVLRQLPSVNAASSTDVTYPLTGEMTIGRDPRCQIVLDSMVYGGVSRQHAQVSLVTGSSNTWQICDLSSANGTFLNGHRLQGCQVLYPGDRITLGQNGPEFVFEQQLVSRVDAPPDPVLPSVAAFAATRRPGEPMPGGIPPSDVTLSQLFPIVSTGRDLTQKAYLVPAILTIAFVILMFIAVGTPVLFNLLLAAYIAGAAYYFVYQLCGKRKPWWLLVSAGVMTMLLLVSPVLELFILVFRVILPGSIPEGEPSGNFLNLLVGMFFGAGLMEELLKAIPVLLAYYIGTQLRSPLRERIGVWEPLDGILLGTASAVGFTLLETLGQYVPNIINDVTLQAGEGTGELVGLQLLIPRVLGSIAGHMAYSGYLGYFIGLSVLKPSKRWQILGVGYLTAAILHTLWNTTGSINFLILAIVGILSYAFLAAAILKARALSPTRSQNFATRFSRLP